MKALLTKTSETGASVPKKNEYTGIPTSYVNNNLCKLGPIYTSA